MAYSPGEIYDSERAKSGNFENFISYESWLEYQYAEMLVVLRLMNAITKEMSNGFTEIIKKMNEL